MNGEVPKPSGDVSCSNSDSDAMSYAQTIPSTRFSSNGFTEFESVISVEPMEDYPMQPAPPVMIFEEHEKTEASDCLVTIGTINSSHDHVNKKPRLASPEKIPGDIGVEIPNATTAEPEDFDNVDVYENVEHIKSEDTTQNLTSQMEQISVSSHSDESANVQSGDSQTAPAPTPAAARLEQISLRIFATILPDNESPEQRHCDLIAARGRLNELTDRSPLLVINCSESNPQLMTIFDHIQNCPFNLNGFPDLATFIAFCERVYDWLAAEPINAVLLNAEGEIAHVRMLLLCHALACYYVSTERQDPTTSQSLRQYISTYPNGVVRSPVSWIRYTGYMRLFSPENCLSILRSSICIYHLTLYNFPVFEENKLRLFFKFYSGCPLRHVYTTSIHTFSQPSVNRMKLSFHVPTDSSTGTHGLYLVGDIAVLAYHCRPYPARRLRLFRLHFHSCQSVTNSLTFQQDDFDEICDAFPSSVRLQFYCTQRDIPTTKGLDAREEILTKEHLISKGIPRNEPNAPLSSDDAIRRHDSLDNLASVTSACSVPAFVAQSRTVSFRSYTDKAYGTRKTRVPTGPVARYLRFASQSDSEVVLPPLCEDPTTDEFDSTEETRSFEGISVRTRCKQKDDNISLHKRFIKALFKAPKTAKDRESVQSIDDVYARQLMPPPVDSTVIKSTKRHRTVRIGTRLKQLLSSDSKEHREKIQHNMVDSAGIRTPSTDSSSETNSFCSLPAPRRPQPPRRPPPPRPPPPSINRENLAASRAGKTTAGVRGTATEKLGPPYKTRKVITQMGTHEQAIAVVPKFHHTEDLLEAARRLNFMAGTQELDQLLEELRLTSMNMASGLPPVGSQSAVSATTPHYYSSRSYSASGYPSRATPPVQPGSYHQRHSESRFLTTRSSSAMGSYGQHDHGPFSYSGPMSHTQPTSYNYLKQSSYHNERRMENLGKSANHYPSYRTPYSPVPSQRHHSTFTTTLKQRPPMGPRQLSQVHLTIDPECGMTETTQGPSSLMNGPSYSRREQLLESELNSARQELAQLRRAISLVDERRSATRHEELTNQLSPSRLPPSRSPGPAHQQQFLSTSTSSYHSQQHGQRSSSTFQRSHPRQDTTYGASYPLHKRAMSQTNVYGPRSWSLRSQQGSESDLAFRRVTSTSGFAGKSSYSAHRERLRQEREQELLMRQQQSQRQRQMAASSTGLHEQHSLQQQSRHQQQYRSLSAVNQTGATEAFEEIETIILQPIGRGVQDIDSRVGSMTMLSRGPGGSLMDGLHRMDDGNRPGLNRRGFSSTQFLHRNTSNSDIARQTVLSQQHAHPSSQPLGPTRFGTSSTLVNNGSAGQQQMSASRSQLSTTSSTIIAPATAPGQTPISNGWKTEPTKRAFMDAADANNLAIVQETAPAWYRPTLSREDAISILRQQPPGSFLIRDSTTYKDAFGLAVKVATLPPKVTPKSDDLQSELVRHYLIEVVNTPSKGVRLKGFASEPVFPSLAALIHQHTIDPLALPCRLILPPVPAHLPSTGGNAIPSIVIGYPASQPRNTGQTLADLNLPADNATVTSAGSILGGGGGGGGGGAASESGSVPPDGLTANTVTPVTARSRVEGGTSIPVNTDGIPTASSPNVPFVCVLHENETAMEGQMSQGLTFRCLLLGSVDTPQWSTDLCFARAVDQLIPLSLLTAEECDRGVSRVQYTEVQLHVSSHDGITIIDLQRRLFLRRHLPNHVLMYCGIEPRKKEFLHPEQKLHGIEHPKIFGIVVRKGISECTTHVFTECDPLYTADTIVQRIRSTYPFMKVR